MPAYRLFRETVWDYMLRRGLAEPEDEHEIEQYFEQQRDLWSIRAFSSLKYHRLSIRDRGENLGVRYTPNKLYSVGVGLAYRFWLIDLGFGINPVGNQVTHALCHP